MSLAPLLRADLTNLRRDPMLLAASLAPLLITGLLLTGLDRLVDVVDIGGHRDLIVGGAILLTPLLIGFVIGFLTVEEKEERILDAVAVTPRGSRGFLAHRLLLPAVVGGVAAGGIGAAVGSQSVVTLLLVSLLAAGTACLVMLTLVAIARDRVQALAVSKLTGFLLVAAVAFQLTDGWWRIPLALSPATWVVETAVSPEPWQAFGVGLVAHAVAGVALWRRVRRTM